MKHNALIVVIILVAVAGLIVLNASFYTVSETEQVVITEFGRPVRTINKPGQDESGLKFKTPFIQDVNRLDKRVMEWDGDPNQVPTKDKLFIYVDTYARWRIQDPLLFFTRLQSEREAHSRLDDILDGETRNAIARHELIEVVRTDAARKPSIEKPGTDAALGSIGDVAVNWLPISYGRGRITKEIFDAGSKKLADLGIELLDIRFKRINYNPDVQKKIYDRMISERQQIADKYRSEGQGEAARIKGEKERDLKKIESEAYKQIQEIRGKADAQATEIYAKAYNQSPAAYDFYQFMQTMETYKTTLDQSTSLVLSTSGDFFRYLQGDGATGPGKWTPTIAAPATPATNAVTTTGTAATVVPALSTTATIETARPVPPANPLGSTVVPATPR